MATYFFDKIYPNIKKDDKLTFKRSLISRSFKNIPLISPTHPHPTPIPVGLVCTYHRSTGIWRYGLKYHKKTKSQQHINKVKQVSDRREFPVVKTNISKKSTHLVIHVLVLFTMPFNIIHQKKSPAGILCTIQFYTHAIFFCSFWHGFYEWR